MNNIEKINKYSYNKMFEQNIYYQYSLISNFIVAIRLVTY